MKINLIKEFLIEEYVNKKIPYYKIAKKMNCSVYAINLALNKFNISIRSRREGIILAWANKKSPKNVLTKQFFEKEYIQNKKSFKEISVLVHCDKKTVIRHFQKYDLVSRSVSEGTKLNTPRGKDNWMFGKKFLGEEGFNYKDGRTLIHNLIRNLKESDIWRNQVFKRDNFRCQECFKTNCYLEAHHIKEFNVILLEFLQLYSQFSPIEDKETLLRLAVTYEPFWDVTNGKTLCKECHSETKKCKRINK